RPETESFRGSRSCSASRPSGASAPPAPARRRTPRLPCPTPPITISTFRMSAVYEQQLVAVVPDAAADDGLPRADAAMERHACGDDAAFAIVFDAVAPHIARYARRILRDESAA